MSLPKVSDNMQIQRAYEECRENGCSHMLAEMLALRQPPMSKTDREFLEGHCNGNQFERTPYAGNYYRKVAKKAGMDITGKVYQAGLAEYPGDPHAWVSGRSDVKRRCEEKGWGCDGAVTLPVRNIRAPDEIAVADDILEERVQDAIDQQPELASKRAELKHEIKEKIKPHWSK